MLQGASLSKVQELGAQMLMMLDRRQDAHRFVEDLRSRLAAAHPDRIRTLFPEWFPAEEDDPLEAAPDQVEWSVPPEAARDELDRWIAANSSGVVRAVDVEPGGWL